jgi:hypothetical protein
MIDDDRFQKPLAALGQIYTGFIGALEEQRRQTLRQSTARMERQAALLRREAERLEKRLGPDHPDVLAIAAAAEDARLVETHDRRALKRAEQWPRVEETDWLLAGRVRGPSGEPAAGVRVRFVDAEDKLTRALGTATADDDGEFSRLYTPKQDGDVLQGQPTVFVELVDGRGQVRLRSERSARVTPGTAAYFDLALTADAPPRPPAPAPRGRTRPTARPREQPKR